MVVGGGRDSFATVVPLHAVGACAHRSLGVGSVLGDAAHQFGRKRFERGLFLAVHAYADVH